MPPLWRHDLRTSGRTYANVSRNRPRESANRDDGQSRFDRDLSPQGCSLNLVDRVELDEIIWIKFLGLESLEADVCWTKDFVAGVEFKKPLHPSVFAMILDRQGT